MISILKPLMNRICALCQRLHKIGILGLIMALLVVSCGGSGTTTASVGSGGTGAFSTTAYSEGAITGFGSILVNGKVYDEKLASVSDEEGQRTLADLKLGMIVQLTGHVDSNGKASADTINFNSKLRGPISAIENNSTTLTILGQKVQITNRTALDRSFSLQGLASFKLGDVLEIHGYLNPVDNTVQATLIELPTRVVSVYKLSGLIRNIDPIERTMQIGTETIDLSTLPDNFISFLMEGSFARLTLRPTAELGTQGWEIVTLAAEYSSSTSQSIAELTGVITEVTSSTEFKINNTSVDANNAALPSSGLKVGDLINIKGELVNGLLIANKISQVPSVTQIEISGLTSQVDMNSKTLYVRGVCVLFAGPVIYENGSEADLVNGINIHVEAIGVPYSHEVQATRITFIR
jgi:hypothetical protein